MIRAATPDDEPAPCPVCGDRRRVLLRVITPAGACPPRVTPCPVCTDGRALAETGGTHRDR